MKTSRINIKYEIETENGVEQKELPFVVGVMANLSGNCPGKEKPTVKQRNFIDVNYSTLNHVMQQISPGIRVDVDNFLVNQPNKKISTQLIFNSMEDFEAENIAKQIPEINKLVLVRQQLKDLLNKSNCSEELETLLKTIIQENAL